MRIMVTGNAGFIGSHVTEGLLQQGHEVIGIDDLSGGSRYNIVNVPGMKPIKFFQADLSNYADMEEIFASQRPEIVYHCAANAREGASYYDPHHIMRTNISATVTTAELAIRYGLQRMIFLSSMAVYGKGKLPFDEKLRPQPVDIYGVMKAASESLLQMLSDAHKFDLLIIRPHNVFGPRQCLSDRYRNVVAIFMNCLMRGEPMTIYGTEHKRAFSYIEDSLPCLLKAVELEKPNSEVINLGGKDVVNISQLALEVAKHFPDEIDIFHKGSTPIHELPARYGEVEIAYSTFKKSEDILGYREDVGWQRGVEIMAEWAHQQGPQEWKQEPLAIPTEAIPEPWVKLQANQRRSVV
jgi:UDP-glucose 4-epimerase